MHSQVDLDENTSVLPPSRTPIRDRAHALQIARGLALGDLLKNGGSVEGFADWLFVRRKSFNGADPLQQASVYANEHRRASKNGVAFDDSFRQQAEQRERVREEVRADAEARLAEMSAYWEDPPLGIEITVAVAELCLGRGSRFAAVRDGEARPSPPAWGLEYLLQVLERFGGPDEALDKYDWSLELAENEFRKHVPAYDNQLEAIRAKILEGESPSAADIFCITWCAYSLSGLSRVRAMLRPLLRQVSMAEHIEAHGHSTVATSQAPTRRRRGI